MALTGIELEILWSNIISLVSEQASALQRVAMSPVVREAGDLACALFDRRGRMIAQANTGTPGHINSIAHSAQQFLKRIPVTDLVEGDVLITNDPWLSAGHFFDITLLTPLFYRNRMIGFAASNIHHTDIGGYGVGAGARDIHEEGLWIPPLKLYEAGVFNETLRAIIKHNVRTPDMVFGDLAAQVSSARICQAHIAALCERQGLDDLEEVSEEIITRSEASMRNTIRALPAGCYRGETTVDVPGGDTITLKAAVTIDSDLGEILIDFDGSSDKSDIGINVVLVYTHAYSSFAIRSVLNPELPNNYGSLLPIKVTAPKGSILNAQYPSPVNARHVVGMYTPMPIFKALHQVVPDRVLAESSGAAWTVQIQGEDAASQAFTSALVGYPGGIGARAAKPGLSATHFPANVAQTSVETIEATIPIMFERQEIRHGSGGDGLQRGGDGEIISFRSLTGRPWLLNALTSRTLEGPEGLEGGSPGAPGRFTINGEPVFSSKKLLMQPDDLVTLETPGGGGFGR